jgi:hypothetical protein
MLSEWQKYDPNVDAVNEFKRIFNLLPFIINVHTSTYSTTTADLRYLLYSFVMR